MLLTKIFRRGQEKGAWREGNRRMVKISYYGATPNISKLSIKDDKMNGECSTNWTDEKRTQDICHTYREANQCL